jgi:hypothetical protein
MQISIKEFRHLAQSAQSIATSGAIIAAVALAWYAFRSYQRAQDARLETDAGGS